MKERTVVLVVVFVAALALSAGVGTAAAQSPGTEEFNETYGGSDNDGAFSVVQTSDGGYALAGSTESFGSGDSDAWLIKTDANGNEQFSKTYGGPNVDDVASVVQTSDGGYILAGETASFGPGTSLLGESAWLIKTDANGNEQFNKTYGGSDSDTALSVVQTSDGGYALAGQTDSFGSGSADAWLVKTDANGNEQFNKTFGGSDFDGVDSVVETSDGGYALAGGTRSYGSGSVNAWLIKTDANGNEEFNKTYGGMDGGRAEDLVQTSDGGYAFVGAKGVSPTALSPTSSSDEGAWLVKTDSTGTEQFNETYGSSVLDRARSVVQTPDGGYAIGGELLPVPLFGSDAGLVKTDANGNEQFNEIYGGVGDDFASSVVETSDGGYALAGETRSFGLGNSDAWLVKVVGNTPPTATFSVSPTDPETGDTVTFDASGSSDPDGSITSYEWDFEGNGVTDQTTASPTVTYTYGAVGDFMPKLTVTDDEGATDDETKTVSVTESNSPPTASFTFSPSSPSTSDTVTFDASGSDDSDGSITSYEWDFEGNGVTDQTTASATATYLYSTAGAFTAELTVTDDQGATDKATRTVTVSGAGTDLVSIDAPDEVRSDEDFEFEVNMTESSVGEVAVESSDFGVELSVVDDAGDSIGDQKDTSVEFIDIDEENSTYILKVNVTGGSEGDTGTITAATGGNIGDSDVDDQASSTFNITETPESPIDDVSDELWEAVTADDGDVGNLSLSDLGNAIQQYQDDPSDADVGGVSIGLSDLGNLIQYYRNVVA